MEYICFLKSDAKTFYDQGRLDSYDVVSYQQGTPNRFIVKEVYLDKPVEILHILAIC